MQFMAKKLGCYRSEMISFGGRTKKIPFLPEDTPPPPPPPSSTPVHVKVTLEPTDSYQRKEGQLEAPTENPWLRTFSLNTCYTLIRSTGMNMFPVHVKTRVTLHYHQSCWDQNTGHTCGLILERYRSPLCLSVACKSQIAEQYFYFV